jgi:DNA-binding response OmpR family regulator
MRKVLIAEDDLLIAEMAEDVLIEHGYEVCGIARTVEHAVRLGRFHKPDLAIIDMRLANGGCGGEIAVQLADLDGLGILYVTGNTSSVLATDSHGHACLAKPYCVADLLRSLEIVADLVAASDPSPPFPRGFTVLALSEPVG